MKALEAGIILTKAIAGHTLPDMTKDERWTYEGYECFIRCTHNQVEFGATGPKGDFTCKCKNGEKITPKIYEQCKLTFHTQVDVFSDVDNEPRT